MSLYVANCLIFLLVLTQPIIGTSAEKMLLNGVVPDVIDKEPSEKLSVVFKGALEVNYGNELTPLQVKDEPLVKWNADSNKLYVLAMVDPDAPSRSDPKFRSVNHWLIGNIPGSNYSSPDAEVIVEYRGSGPPKGSGLHRYVFLVYEQPSKLTFDEPKSDKLSRENRLNFSIMKFAEKYKLGNAIAGNFHQAQWDEYVDERNKAIDEHLKAKQ